MPRHAAMTRAEKVRRAKQLRRKGLSYEQIGRQLGVSLSSAYEYCTGRKAEWAAENAEKLRRQNLARNDQKREWERAQAGTCEECGEQLSRAGATRCTEHERQRREAEGRERTERFIRLRLEGLNNRQIGQLEGVPPHIVALTFHRAGRYGLVPPPLALLR